jgi:hypothetical protein
MRTTGIYILLGITISLAIFVFAGIVYFRPAVQEMRFAETAAAAEREETAVITTQSLPQQKPAEDITEKKEAVPSEESVEAVQVPVQPTDAATPSAPTEDSEVDAQEMRPVAAEEVGEAPAVPASPRVPSPPVVRMTVTPVPVPETEPIVEQAVIEEVLEEPVAEAPAVSEEPEVYDIQVYYRPPAPKALVEAQAVLPTFTKPEPVEYVWTPTTIPEGPTEHVNPVVFTEEAFNRRQKAVEEVYDKLIWD